MIKTYNIKHTLHAGIAKREYTYRNLYTVESTQECKSQTDRTMQIPVIIIIIIFLIPS